MSIPTYDYEKKLERLVDFLDRRRALGQGVCAIFDIGTKAARILVGPKAVPPNEREWYNKSFFNDGRIFNLGSAIDTETQTLPLDSPALAGIVRFIKVYLEELQEDEIDLSDVFVLGTAVFRWMKNKEEVLKHIQEQTKLNLIVLEKENEALLSSLSIYHTSNYNYTDKDESKLGEQDYILLIDQGGGSTEISYFSPKNLSVGQLQSINQLGTIALQNDFFTLDEESPIDPVANINDISVQFKLINQLIDKRLADWDGFPELEGASIVAYGMGSAMSNSLPAASNHKNHNRKIQVQNIKNRLYSSAGELEVQIQRVNKLYKLLQNNENPQDKLKSKLVLLYGLPVYLKILERFNLEEIRFAGYGLRYGAYLAHYAYFQDLNKLANSGRSDNIFEDINEQFAELKLLGDADNEDDKAFAERILSGIQTRLDQINALHTENTTEASTETVKKLFNQFMQINSKEGSNEDKLMDAHDVVRSTYMELRGL